jgi:sarcosine oxidase
MNADVIVVGLGAAGAATLYQLARRGARVLGIDAFTPPHDRGSSHGQTRITRQAVGEGDDYVPLALRAHELWRQIEAESGERLFEARGLAVIGRLDRPAAHTHKPDFLRRTLSAAQRFGIPHEVITPAECRARHPSLAVDETETVYWEPGAGMLFPERCIGAQIALARRHGAEVRTGEPVLRIEACGGGVRVATASTTHAAGQVVVAAGAWAPRLLGEPFAAVLAPYRQTMHWFAPEESAVAGAADWPVFIWMHGAAPDDWFYGFPQMPGDAGVKVAAERFDAALARADDVDRAVSSDEADSVYRRHIEGRLQGLSPTRLRSSACLYTMAPGGRFVIGRDPARERVMVVSACSGHGFKHSAAIGEAVARLALDAPTPGVLDPFDPARWTLAAKSANRAQPLPPHAKATP